MAEIGEFSCHHRKSEPPGLFERHGLWDDAQFEAAKRAERLIEEHGLEVVRLSFPDQHGILRGKTLMAADAARAMRNGCAMTTTLLAKDTAQKTAFPVFTAGGGFGMPEMEGGADFLMIADPATFRVLPWAPKTGWVLCDIYFGNGKPVPFDPSPLSPVAVRARRCGLRLHGRARSRIPHLQDRRCAARSSEAATWPPEAPKVSLLSPGYAFTSPRPGSIRWSRCSRRSGARWSRLGCRCVRSRSNSDRANASSRSIRRSASRPPTP